MNEACSPGGRRRVYAVAVWATYTPEGGDLPPQVVGRAEAVLATSYMEADSWAADLGVRTFAGPQWREHGRVVGIADRRLLALDGTQCPPPEGHVLGGRPEDHGLRPPPTR